MTQPHYTSREVIDSIIEATGVEADRARRAERLRALAAAALPQIIATRPQLGPADWAARALETADHVLQLIEERTL